MTFLAPTDPRRAAIRQLALGIAIALAICSAAACTGTVPPPVPAEASAARVSLPAAHGDAALVTDRAAAAPPSQVASPAPPEPVPTAPALSALPPPRLSSALPEYVGAIHGQLVEQWFQSDALDRPMRYFVYLPPDYDTTDRSYPVLYMLHGASGWAEEWVYYGVVNRADEAIAARAIAPYLIVLPEGEFGYWINHAYDGPRWGDYVARDVVGHVDGAYRTLASPASRAIGGLSMGAAGGLIQAFTHPSIFGVVGAHSPTPRQDNSVVWFLGEGEEFAARDPIYLARITPDVERLKIWVDVGDEDPFRPRVVLLHQALAARGIDHEWHPRPGGHGEEYWVANLPDYVRFYHRALNGNR